MLKFGNTILQTATGAWLNMPRIEPEPPAPTKYNVNITASGGTVIATPSSGYTGETVTLSYVPQTHYEFTGYTVTGATLYDGNKFVIGTSDVSVIGNFAAPTSTSIYSSTNEYYASKQSGGMISTFTFNVNFSNYRYVALKFKMDTNQTNSTGGKCESTFYFNNKKVWKFMLDNPSGQPYPIGYSASNNAIYKSGVTYLANTGYTLNGALSYQRQNLKIIFDRQTGNASLYVISSSNVSTKKLTLYNANIIGATKFNELYMRNYYYAWAWIYGMYVNASNNYYALEQWY